MGRSMMSAILLADALESKRAGAEEELEQSLQRAFKHKITVAVSRATLAEVEEVLLRSELRLKYPLLMDERVTELLDRLFYRGIYLRQVRQYFTYPRDPKDEPQLNLAIEVKADYLISRDNDLLDLMDWHKEEGRELQKRFSFLKIVPRKSSCE
jgi:putative PIN family toxin of toxin-antitoxin system